jgi:hypothetical protein
LINVRSTHPLWQVVLTLSKYDLGYSQYHLR